MSIKPKDWEDDNKVSEFQHVDETLNASNDFLKKAIYFVTGFLGYLLLAYWYKSHPFFGVNLNHVVYEDENMLLFMGFPFLFELILINIFVYFITGGDYLLDDKNQHQIMDINNPADKVWGIGNDD